MAQSDAKTARDVTEGPWLPGRARHVDFALVVGVDHYPRFRSLRGAITDAEQVHAWLCDSDGGGVDPAHARLIRSSEDPIAPLQDQIDDGLLELVSAADALGGGRRLYFHFSGHGASCAGEPSDDVALLLAKWCESLARAALSSDGYRGVLGAMGLFEELAVTLDCCRSTAVRAIGLPPMLTYAARTPCCATRTFVAYATEPRRSAFERLDCAQWQGVFTQRLLAILRSSPCGITAVELQRALVSEVMPGGQRAYVVNGLCPDSRFGRCGTAPELEITFELARGRVRLRDGSLAVIADHDVAAGPWRLTLDAGLYKVEDAFGRELAFEHGWAGVTRVEL